ncbi:unnamed protein product [Bursaphelenchus xylophilus]|uniref:(pine wood nematode) hypothetical protein n=1 Tax=Bursaphelenchus xylophilus TaxID=6326 RepID=A0A1I7SW19_BURXY|nr:unnamed protein product [Bursaphelenchus xylophilus]CAG9098675.1 unnamed protein product [Bursaphelenchus xylophilus]
MSLEVNAASKVKLAGCSTVRCMVAKNTCTSAPLNGKMGTICCCSGDLCNANQPKSTGDKMVSLLNGVIAGKNGG